MKMCPNCEHDVPMELHWVCEQCGERISAGRVQEIAKELLEHMRAIAELSKRGVGDDKRSE